MFLEIKNKIEKELTNYISSVDKLYSLSKISPILFKNINEFLCRKGKRIRPTLFVIGYLGFAKKVVPGLYRSAISIELLHDFLLVHDDIIDKADTRRGKPSMHAMLDKYLSGNKNLKFSSQDLSIVVGDVIYAMALDAFLSIKEDMKRKEAALKKLIEAALYTGSGEFLELLNGMKSLDKITRNDIYKIYDLKTANYSFASPLAIGATLAGAKQKQIDLLLKYGTYIGRAFQIKDDILGMFNEESVTGKSNLTDLKEAKKTILIWYAYNNSEKKNRAMIKRIFAKPNVRRSDLGKMRRIILSSGALDYAKKEISELTKNAQALSMRFKIRKEYLGSINKFARKLLAS
jgi:geranylgeranyl diphosphate synthase type I